MVTNLNLTGVVKRNARERNIWEGPVVIMKRILRVLGGYYFKGGGEERRILCGEGNRVGDGRIGWEGGGSMIGWEI